MKPLAMIDEDNLSNIDSKSLKASFHQENAVLLL